MSSRGEVDWRKADSLKIDFSAWTLPLFGTVLLLLIWSLLSSPWSVAKGSVLALLVGTPVGFVIGVRAIPVDYLNIANVLQLSPWKRLTRILLPATWPYMLTGFRFSLAIAGLVIVAVEMFKVFA